MTIWLHHLLSSALVGSEWSASCISSSIPWESIPITHWRDGPHSWIGYFGEEKNLLPLLETEPWCLGCPATSPGIILTLLLQLLIMKQYSKVKGELVPVHTTRASRGWRGIAPLILNLSISHRWEVIFSPCHSNPGERTPSIHWISGWVVPTATFDILGNRTI
jgi:hypothetical protein